jgi:hypothetical protein
MSHSSLENYYYTVFSMVQHHKYSITEIENLMPFERDLYAEMLLNYLKEIEESRQRNQ